MSKITNAIKMLHILSVRDLVSKTELAEHLDTNMRNISEYRQVLLDAGYDIEALPGRFGGYRLNREKVMPNPRLTESEKEVLLKSADYLNKRYDFLDKTEFQSALGKVLSTTTTFSHEFDNLIIDRFPLSMPEEEIKARYNALNKALSNHQKIEIYYLSSKNKMKRHVIHPYKLYMYNLAWYVLAFNESFNDVGYFKLNRIDSYEILPDKFIVMRTFEVSDYLDKFGMRQNGEYIDVSILLKTPYSALVKERIYGKNQKLEFVDDDTTILSCRMQGVDSIISFVLGCGAKAKILKPEWLEKKLKDELRKMIEIYKD